MRRDSGFIQIILIVIVVIIVIVFVIGKNKLNSAVTVGTPMSTQTPVSGGNTKLTPNDWKEITIQESPDGKYLMWINANGLRSIGVMLSNSGGSEIKTLVSNDQLWIGSPTWSPDSKQIAYIKDIGIGVAADAVLDRLDLYIINIDGTNNHLVSQGINTPVGAYFKTDLSWSAAGISYTDSSTFSGSKIIIPSDKL